MIREDQFAYVLNQHEILDIEYSRILRMFKIMAQSSTSAILNS